MSEPVDPRIVALAQFIAEESAGGLRAFSAAVLVALQKAYSFGKGDTLPAAQAALARLTWRADPAGRWHSARVAGLEVGLEVRQEPKQNNAWHAWIDRGDRLADDCGFHASANEAKAAAVAELRRQCLGALEQLGPA